MQVAAKASRHCRNRTGRCRRHRRQPDRADPARLPHARHPRPGIHAAQVELAALTSPLEQWAQVIGQRSATPEH